MNLNMNFHVKKVCYHTCLNQWQRKRTGPEHVHRFATNVYFVFLNVGLSPFTEQFSWYIYPNVPAAMRHIRPRLGHTGSSVLNKASSFLSSLPIYRQNVLLISRERLHTVSNNECFDHFLRNLKYLIIVNFMFTFEVSECTMRLWHMHAARLSDPHVPHSTSHISRFGKQGVHNQVTGGQCLGSVFLVTCR